MKKCQTCGYDNTDVMNFCLECGSALADAPQMVIPLDSLGGQNAGRESEKITENFENETVVRNRFPIQQSVQTFQQETPPSQPKSSNTKLFIALGGGLFAIIILIGVAAAGVLIYTIQSQEQRQIPKRPIVANRPAEDKTSRSTPIKDDDFPTIDVEPQSSPNAKNTSDATEQTITFPKPSSPTKKGTYKVRSITGWQLSEVKTVGSQNFRVRLKGKIKFDGIKRRVGAKGVNGHTKRRIIKEFKTGALLMRTHYPDGSHSKIQPVASSQYWVNEPNETGKIEFLINDNSPESNKGSFSVTVTDMGIQKK